MDVTKPYEFIGFEPITITKHGLATVFRTTCACQDHSWTLGVPVPPNDLWPSSRRLPDGGLADGGLVI